jgi:hypothetical protein
MSVHEVDQVALLKLEVLKRHAGAVPRQDLVRGLMNVLK